MILTCKIDWKDGNGYVLVDNPNNIDGILIDVLFTSRTPNAVLRNLDLEWSGQNAIKMNAYKLAGRSGGYGITEGLGLQIFGCDLWFDGYIDLQSIKTRWQCDMVTAPCVQFGRVDWLEARARGISFKYLRDLPVGSPGRIIPAIHYKKTPYTVTRYRTRSEKLMIEGEIIGILIDGYKTVCEISQAVNDLIADATNAALTLGTLVSSVLFDLLNIILYTVYLIALILAEIDRIIEFVSAYYQVKKYKLCMTWEECFKRIAERFNMQFSSTILQQGNYVGLTWMPPKTVIPNPSNPLNIFRRPADENIGFPNNLDVWGCPDGDCASWILEAEKHFDAQISIRRNPNTGVFTLYFENRFYWNNVANYTFPNIGKVGNTYNLPQPYGTNLSELPSNLLVEFQIDQADENTFMRDAGRVASVNVSQTIVYNEMCVSHNTAKQVTLSTALAKRKEYLNPVEIALDQLFTHHAGFINTTTALVNGVINAANAVINLFGGSSATPIPTFQPFAPIHLRLEWLELSGDDFSISKVFIGYDNNGDWLIKKTNEQYVNADRLEKDFWRKNLATQGNQQDLYYEKEVDFCCADYNKVIYNNIINTPSGLGKLYSFTIDPHNEKAINVNYGVFVTETTNQHETYIIDG